MDMPAAVTGDLRGARPEGFLDQRSCARIGRHRRISLAATMAEILRPWDRAAREDSNYEVAPAPLENDWIAAVSSSWISNTPYSLVVFSRSRTWTDGFSSLISAA